MTVAELIELLLVQDQNKRVVVADRDGAGTADDVEFIDQRMDGPEPVISISFGITNDQGDQ